MSTAKVENINSPINSRADAAKPDAIKGNWTGGLKTKSQLEAEKNNSGGGGGGGGGGGQDRDKDGKFA